MEGTIIKLLIDQQLYLVLAFAIGVAATFLFLKKIYGDRVDSLKKQLTETIEKYEERLEESDTRCEARLSDMRNVLDRMQKRIDTLEDSRTFILNNQIKELKKLQSGLDKEG